jgi:hypothetical protein
MRWRQTRTDMIVHWPYLDDILELPALSSPPGSVGRARFLPRPRLLIWLGVCEGVAANLRRFTDQVDNDTRLHSALGYLMT